ncbi:MAG: O-antigen ligase family protein [Proteobacteria bacterium]|nr:O-antigen ligase family protein [Pseudomonadota bacterium]MBU4009451.1 O-antigen ligase family protein [Pseudomonadota bacterium]
MLKIKKYNASVLLIPFVFYLMLFFSPLGSKAHNNYFYLIILLPFILFAKSVKEEFYRIVKSKLFVSVIVFVSYMALTGVFNISSAPLNELVKPLRHWFSFLVFFFICILFFYKHDLEEKMKYVSLWAAFWGGLSFLVFFYDKSFAERLCYLGRVEHPIYGACTYAIPFLFLVFSEKQPAKAYRFSALFILLLCIIFTQSRGPIIALSAAVLAGLIVQRRIAIPVLIGFSGIVLWLLEYKNIISCGKIFCANSSFRIPIWKQVISESINNSSWLLGHGMAANETVFITPDTSFLHAHSGYVGTFFLGGIIGLVLLLNLVFHIIKQSLTVKSVRQDSLTISLVTFALLSIATDTHKLLLGPHPIWFFFWLPVAYLVAENIKSGD